ncbi:pantoate--beta-alanine ligase [Mesorhizobium sp.]|uniref:pantoate--beta-alanine ligase n=1 Tax=Mesorhizobium sp. TaxID=1871066 RepID=UPI00257D39E3|nr:pantoate--beta-alanine ligase [Mesorhizobium sp.]
MDVVACPTVREPDGLALSSRNVRLSPLERQVAPRLAAILFATAARITSGAPVEATLDEARSAIAAAGYTRIEYLELRAEGDLAPIQTLDRPARLLAAAWLGDTRLIDNVQIPSRSGAITRTAA